MLRFFRRYPPARGAFQTPLPRFIGMVKIIIRAARNNTDGNSIKMGDGCAARKTTAGVDVVVAVAAAATAGQGTG